MEPILELTEPHAIALCDDIKPGGVHPIQLQDVELVLWRDYAGQAHVWHDRCPHRGMRLSFGFVKENRLTCLYHGWEYGSDGGCRKIPAHPEVTPPKTLCADILNVSECYGMVFVSAGKNTVETNTEWVSVRSIFLECDRARALAGIAEFVEITEAQENQVYLNKSNTVAVAVQPCSRTSCAIHLSTRSTDPTGKACFGQTDGCFAPKDQSRTTHMTVTSDIVALNQWLPVAYPGQVTPAKPYETLLLGQPIRLTAASDGTVTALALDASGAPERELPIIEQFAVIFTTLGDSPRPMPIIQAFDEPDRRIVNCGSVGVHASPFRIVENFLDMAHFCFVHTDILGAKNETEVLSYKTEHRQDVDEIWATGCQFFQPAASPAAAKAGEGQMTDYTYRVLSPFGVMLYKSALGYADRLDAICLFIQPKTETECIGYMPMALLDDTSSNTGMIDFQQTIFLQDRIILENQRPKLLPLTPRSEMPTRADLSSVAFRRWLKDSGMKFGLLHEEAA